MKKLLKGLQYALLLLLAVAAYGSDKPPIKVDLVLPVDNVSLRQLASEIASPSDYQLQVYINELPDPTQAGDVLLLVSDGLLPMINSAHYPAKLALYANSVRFSHYRAENASAVYSDQPIARQIKLIDAILKGKPARIAMAWESPSYHQQLHQLTDQYPQYQFNSEQIPADGSASQRKLNRLIQRSDVLLATPEQNLYNAATIRGVLLATYRHQNFLIGPNAGFVSAGALASVVSKPSDYAAEAKAMINHYRDHGRLPMARYPQRYSITINRNVADSLGLVIDDEQSLLNTLRGQ